jgi:hypothetical protein
VGVNRLGGTDRREVDTEQARADDDTGLGRVRGLPDPAGVLEGPEVVNAVGVGVFDRQLCRGSAGRDQQLIVLVGLAVVCREGVCVGVDAGDVGVEPEVDVALVVPLGLVDRDRGLGQLPLCKLLYQNAVVEGLTLVGDDGDVRVGVLLADRLGRRATGDPVAHNDMRRGHINRLGAATNVDCHLGFACDLSRDGRRTGN